MLTSVNRTLHAKPVPFSFAQEFLGRPQQVQAVLGGFEYPGEVIVAPNWLPEYGEPLSGVSMFRLVLLQSSAGPTSSDIVDSRICVAVQAVAKSGAQRIGESAATYDVGNTGSRSKHMAEADIRSLREVRENYLTGNDPELSRLVSALSEYESQINSSLAGDSYERWKSGHIVTSQLLEKSAVNSQQAFLLEHPESWLEIVAVSVLDHQKFSESESTCTQIFHDLQSGRIVHAKEKLRHLSGIRLGDWTPLDGIQRLLAVSENSPSQATGTALVDLLIHEHAYPPAVAWLWIVAFVLENDSEVELTQASSERKFVSIDDIEESSFDDVPIDKIVALRADKSDDWDAVLPFLRLIAPHASSTRYGGGRESDAEEFNLQLATVGNRVRQATPVMLSLEIATGSGDKPLTRNANQLIGVLRAGSWREYVAQARVVFRSVSALRNALSGAALHWALVEVAPEIEWAIYYLDQVEFGRVDHALAVERQLLRSRFELGSLIDSPLNWLSLRDEFERWRQEFRRAYLEDHAERQERNRLLQRQVEQSTIRVGQILLLEQVEVIRLDTDIDIAGLWNETIRLFVVCENDSAGIPLIDSPACPECHGRLGQPANHTDIIGMISEIDQIFIGYRDRLASVASSLVLKSANADSLQSLFRLNSAGDLSDLANVLDDKVITFLNELFGKSNGSSGKNGDWTSPHS